MRIDFTFYRASDVAVMLTWPNSPVSAEAMVLYDATGGTLMATGRRFVGKDLGPGDPHGTFARATGDFWYYLLRCFALLQRNQLWAVRYDFNDMVLGNLLALLRIEAGAVSRWQATNAATRIERALPPSGPQRGSKLLKGSTRSPSRRRSTAARPAEVIDLSPPLPTGGNGAPLCSSMEERLSVRIVRPTFGSGGGEGRCPIPAQPLHSCPYMQA